MKFYFILLFCFVHLTSYGQFTLVWSDEFDSSELNLEKWTYDTGQGSWGWGNNELQSYTNSNSNVMLDDGHLTITAKEEQLGTANYTSGRIKSQGLFDFKYGRVQARIQVPIGQGLWPAFWMLGSNINSVNWPQCGEIDVMEHINNELVIHGTHHFNNNGHQYLGNSVYCDAGEFNVYSIEWSPLTIQWFLNGVMFYQADISSNSISKEEFHEPFFFIINLAVGGNWPGAPSASTPFPAIMLVDYVRVYQESVGVDEIDDPNVTVIPNPSSDFIRFSSKVESEKYVIYNLQGEKILEGLQKTQIDISSLLSGMYFVDLKLVNGKVTRTSFVKH